MRSDASRKPAPGTAFWRPLILYPQTACVFLPAPFDLIELDDATAADRERPRRLLLHANGLVVEPAEQVLLGWIGSSGAQVTTATRRYAGPFSPEDSGRADAIYLASNIALDGAGAPLLPLQEWGRLQATSGAGDPRWYQAAVAIDDCPAQAEAIDVELGSFGWLAHDDLIAAFALRQLPVHDLRLRTLRQASAARYPCNPLTPRT